MSLSRHETITPNRCNACLKSIIYSCQLTFQKTDAFIRKVRCIRNNTLNYVEIRLEIDFNSREHERAMYRVSKLWRNSITEWRARARARRVTPKNWMIGLQSDKPRAIVKFTNSLNEGNRPRVNFEKFTDVRRCHHTLLISNNGCTARHAARTTLHFNSVQSAIGEIADTDRCASPICSSISLPRTTVQLFQVGYDTRGPLFTELPLVEKLFVQFRKAKINSGQKSSTNSRRWNHS